MEPGGDVILPVTYWPGRAMLYLSADRNDLFRGSDYLEIAGDGPEGRSDRVKSMCRLAEGTVMHAWVIASNVSRLVEEAERRNMPVPPAGTRRTRRNRLRRRRTRRNAR